MLRAGGECAPQRVEVGRDALMETVESVTGGAARWAGHRHSQLMTHNSTLPGLRPSFSRGKQWDIKGGALA